MSECYQTYWNTEYSMMLPLALFPANFPELFKVTPGPSTANCSSRNGCFYKYVIIQQDSNYSESYCLLYAHQRISPTTIEMTCQLRYMYSVSKKNMSPNFCLYLHQIFFHWHTLWKICNKAFIKYPTTPLLRRYTTLWNINFQKLL